jgi:hypothetical protein
MASSKAGAINNGVSMSKWRNNENNRNGVIINENENNGVNGVCQEMK